MRIDLTCPAEILTVELPAKEEPWVRLLLMDTADRGINSCEATVKILDEKGAELARTVHRARALTGRPHGTFWMTVPMEPRDGAARAEAQLDKIWFEDNDVWRRNPDHELSYEENALPPGNDLNALKYVAGPAAVGFPSQQAELWVCVCGRPNGNRSLLCARCRRQKDMIFQQYNRNAVLRQVSQRERQLDLKTRGAREEAAQLQRVREEAYNRQQARKRTRRRLGLAMGAALLLTAGVYCGGVPALRLWSADQALREGKLAQAEETLEALGSFPGAESRLAAARLAMARRDGGDAVAGADMDADTLGAIADRLREADALDADRMLAQKVDLKRAEKLLADGDIDGAETLLRTLPEETEGRETLLKDCVYARGEAALSAKDFDTARAFFLELGSWRDAETQAENCLYEPALQRMEAGEYEEAIALLSQIPDYLDSGELIRKSWYLKGYTLEMAGETEAARQAYLTADGYEDAADRARALRWAQAEKELAAENYAEAMPIYQELDGDGDAREKWILCATEMARAAYKVRDYDRAAELLTGLPEDTADTTRIRTRALYLGAKADAERGELEKAIEKMSLVSTYGDAGKNLRTWRMELAQQKMDAGAWAEAKELLTPIAEYYQAQRMLRQVEEKLAEAEKPTETEAP